MNSSSAGKAKVNGKKGIQFILEALTLDVNQRLDQVPSDLILQKIFRPYYCLIKLFGIVPLKISEDGKSKYKFLSWSTLYALIIFCIFLIDSCTLIPMFVYLVKNKDNGEANSASVVTHAAQIMFISCQYLGAALSYLLIPFSTPKLSKFWNRFQGITFQISDITSNRVFLGAFVSGRWNIRIWLWASFSFSLFCLYSYGDGFESYMDEEQGSVIYWIYYIGFCFFPFFMSFHIIHSILFGFFTFLLQTCFMALRTHCETLKELKIDTILEDNTKFLKALKLYEEINELIGELGDIYGLHVALEMVIMMTCICLNLFFAISEFKWTIGVGVYVAVIIPYLAWFHWICNCGHTLGIEANKCLKSLKQLGYESSVVEYQLLEAPKHLSARGYFEINMKLFTTVAGTVTTYLVVMLQFKVGSHAPSNSKLEKESFSKDEEAIFNYTG